MLVIIYLWYLLVNRWGAISVEASGYFTFDDEGCSSCISVMNVSYPSLVGNLFVMLSNGSELDLGAVTDSQQMVALTHDDSAGPQITDIKVFLERDGQLIDVILVGTGSISSDTLYVIVGEDVSIDVTIQTQIDVVFGVDYGDSITVMENCGGPISSFKLIHTYANPGQFQLNVEASDMVSGGQSSALSIEAIYNLNGITANDNGVSDLLEPGNLLTLSVSIAAGANVPFGQTTLNVTCPTEMVTELLTITAGGMQPISCNMSLPGSYEIAVIAIGPLENKHLFNRTYKVWDNLKFKFVPTGEAFAIGFKPTFTLENAPVYNFDYILDFGEGTIVEKNGTDHLMTLFETIEIPVLNYNEPGNYTMHVVGSNPEYTIVQDISFIFEHAIPPSHIKHDITGMLLCPPGDVLFSIYANSGIAEPLPTDVSCTFDFGDGTVESEARVNLSYDSVGLGKQVEHIYTTEDIMNILFVCSNRVSNISITSVIDARIMNVNIIEVTHYEFLLMNDTNPVDLEITYAVINFTSPPPNLTHAISWDIAETLVEVDMTQLNDIHTYSSRDAFLVSIFFEYYSVERTESKYVKVGGVNFFLDPSSSRIGQTNTTSINFQLVRYLVSENHVVAVDWGDGSSPTDLTYGPTAVTPQTVPVFPTGVTSTISHIFIKRGVFNPVVTYTSVRGMEIYHMNDTVYIENEIKDLQIATEETYTFADDIIPIITMGNFSDPVRNISCSFNYTEGSVTEMGDLSNDTSSITTIINYSELGDKVLWVTCSNYLSEQVLNASYLVFSICFDSSSLFDRTYRTPAMALKIYTSLPQVITGRASLTDVCKNRTNIVYTWTAEKVNGSRLDEIVIAPPNSISFLILNFLSEPAIYKLTLNISFPGYPEDYIKDYMFVELIDPPLVGLINYGSERSVSIGMPVDLDAATQSHDPRVGFGVDDPLLRFSWNCYIITDNTTVQNYAKPLSTDTSYRSNPPCGFTLPNEGKIVGLDTSGATPNSWYLVEVTVRKDVRYVNSVQVLFMTTADAPLIGITCKLNCLQKLLPEDITYLQSDVVCPSCTQTQLDNAVYLWSFYKHNFATGEDERQLWTPGITTARSDKEFRTGNNFFEEGGSYMVELEVDIPGKDMGQTTFRININWYPYGGTCDLLPLTGWSTVTRYQITCNDWKDEGVRFIKDATMDVGEPVRYRVEQKTRLGSFVVYEGAEKSTPPFFLQMCDGTDGFNCRVVTYIKDLFSSEATVTNSVDVQSPVGYYLSKSINESNGTEVSEAESLSEFFLKMQEEVNVTKGFGSVFVTAQVASAFASVLNSIPLQPSSVDNLELINNNDSLATGQLILDGLRNVDPMETEVKNLLEFMILAITESIKDYDIKEDVSVSDVSVFSSSLTSAIDDPTLISETAQSAISKTAVDLSNNLLTKLNETVTIKDVMVAMGAISDLQDKIIDIGSPDMSGFLPQGTDYSNVIYDPQGDGFNPYEQQYFTELMNQRKKANAAGNIRNAQETITACQTIWENAFTIMNKATADNTIFKSDHNNFNTELMKGIIEQIVDLQKSKTDTVIGADQQGVTFNFTGITEDVKDKSSADLKTVLLKKSIYIQGPNSPIYTSPVVHAAVKKSNIPELPIVRSRAGYPYPQNTNFIHVPTPKFIDEDASFMFYWRFVYRHKFEYLCVSIRPTVPTIKYEAFWRSKIPPSDFEYDFTHLSDTIDDWVEQLDGCIKPGGLKRLGAGFLGLRPYQVDPVTRKKRATNQTQTSFGGNANSNNPLEAPYWIRLLSFSCASWNGVTQDWDPNNCEVEMDLRNNRTACLCQNPTNQEITASSFFVPPNSIDFSTVFSKFDIKSQAAVLAVIIIITLIAILAGIWGHWKDRQDKLQWGVTVLADNYKDDSYFYLITVYTGLVRGGGTTSNISFNLSGERDDSGVRTLTDGVRKEFSAGSVMHFLMAVPTSLGALQCFRVWHDNAGKGRHASWYLSRIEIHDIQTNDRYDFLCSDWLSVEDGHIERLVPVSGRINFNNFKTMFYEHARSHVTDDHLWLSVFLRPVKSHFYRVQRIGCCYALLMLTMIANAMFFEGKGQKDRQQLSQIELGPIRFSLNQLYISFVSILITAIPIFLIILLFRKTKLKLNDRRTTKDPPNWLPKFIKEHVEFSNRLEEALVVRDIVDDKEGILPHFCVYIAWVIIFIAAFVSAFFLMLFSMEWGKSLSEEWLTSFFLSFLQSMVVVDPFKVIFMAVVFALFLKAIKSSKPTHYDLKEITLLANEKGQPNAGRRRLKFSMPYSEEEFQRLKLQRERNVRMKQSVKELCFNSVFLWILFSISYSNRDQQSYLLHQYVQNNFMEPPKPFRTYEKIGEAAHFFDWLNSTVLPTLFTEDDYRGYRMVSSQRLFSYDTNNFRVGPPRLRQVRTKKTTCDIPYVGNTECILGYQLPIEDTGTYCMGWTSTPCPDFEKLALTYEAYKFTSALDIWGYPIAGQHNVYGGGGYIANLDVNMLISFESLKELFNSKWIDRNTRAVFFEYTLYNVNKNIFVYVSLLTEFPETGGTLTFSNIYPFRPSQHEGAQAAYVLLCELAFCVYIVINVIIIIIRMAKQKLRYFKQFWQVIDLIMIGVAIAAIALYAVREGFTADALQKYRDNNREFVNFYHVAIWDGTFVAFLGFLVAIATVRLIKALGYTSRTAKIYNVLKNSSKVLPGLSFYIVTVLTSFGFWGLICFGSNSERYFSFITSLETLFMAILGSPDFKETRGEIQDTWITILYFCLFVVMVTLTLTTIFLAIMLDVMAMTQGAETSEADLDMELISYVWQSFLGIFTGRKPDMKGNQRMTNVMTAARLAQENNRKPQSSEDGENDIPYLISRSNSVRSLKPVTNIRGRIVYQ